MPSPMVYSGGFGGQQQHNMMGGYAMVPMMCLPMNPNNPLNPLMDAAKQMRALGNVSYLEWLITVNESNPGGKNPQRYLK